MSICLRHLIQRVAPACRQALQHLVVRWTTPLARPLWPEWRLICSKARRTQPCLEIWSCDFLRVTDRCFRSLCAFFILELSSRTVIHYGVTRHPTDAWIAQQLREATPFGDRLRYLIRDNDSKFGPLGARIAATSRIELLRTPFHAPRAHAICERFLGSVRRECLDHVLVLHERYLRRVLQQYIKSFNRARPHQGLEQAIPDRAAVRKDPCPTERGAISLPVLGGLHHDYQWAA